MQFNSRTGKIVLTVQEQKELRRAAKTIEMIEKFAPPKAQPDSTHLYLTEIADRYGKEAGQ